MFLKALSSFGDTLWSWSWEIVFSAIKKTLYLIKFREREYDVEGKNWLYFLFVPFLDFRSAQVQRNDNMVKWYLVLGKNFFALCRNMRSIVKRRRFIWSVVKVFYDVHFKICNYEHFSPKHNECNIFTLRWIFRLLLLTYFIWDGLSAHF